MKFIGIDLTSAFSRVPRPVDVAMLDDDKNVTFLQVHWPDPEKVVSRDPVSAIEMILKPLRLGPTEPFILAIDGPQGLADPGRTQRACERILGTPGRTPSELPPDAEGAPFQGYIRSSIDLFAALVDGIGTGCNLMGLHGRSKTDANLFEVFPGAEWVVLAGERLTRKTTVAGRQERQQLFRLLGLTLPAQLPTADQNDALVGSYLAWCVRHQPNAVVLVGEEPTSRHGQIHEGCILHALAQASESPIVGTSRRPAVTTHEDLPGPVANELGEDWNEDEELLLFLNDYGAVHGSAPENAWLVTGVNYVLETMPPDHHVHFNLCHSPGFSGGRGWKANPTVMSLLTKLAHPTPPHLKREGGVTLRVRVLGRSPEIALQMP